MSGADTIEIVIRRATPFARFQGLEGQRIAQP